MKKHPAHAARKPGFRRANSAPAGNGTAVELISWALTEAIDGLCSGRFTMKHANRILYGMSLQLKLLDFMYRLERDREKEQRGALLRNAAKPRKNIRKPWVN